MEPGNPFTGSHSLSSCDKDSDSPAGWGSGFSLWEEQCFREAEDSVDQERQLVSEKDAINQRLWLLFQSSACSIAQLYRGMITVCRNNDPLTSLSPDRAHGQSMWLPFQVAASNVTTLYRECVESQKKMNELCAQAGAQRRNRELLSWLKKRKRGLIRQEELVAFICGKNSGKERHDRHSNCRSPRRVTSGDPFTCTGSSPSHFPATPSAGFVPDHRLHHSRSPPQTLSCLSLSDPVSQSGTDANGVSAEAVASTDSPATDLQPFRDALALSSLTGGTLLTGPGGRRLNRTAAQISSCSPADLEELNAFISAEFNRNVDSKKRPFPNNNNDVVMSSPTHKKPKFL